MREVIALDIDDVLSDSMDAVRLEVNERLGVDLQPKHYKVAGDYWGYYESVWEKHGLKITFDELDEESMKRRYVPTIGAQRALGQLARTYKLIAITSRNEAWQEMTTEWLDEHFPGAISTVLFAGNKEHSTYKTKGEMCVAHGAKWLIDDNVEHCLAARTSGLTPILFGEYGWHVDAPDDMVKCKGWPAVLEYFDGIG